MNPELELAARLAADYIASFDSLKVSIEADPDAIRAKLCKQLGDDGLPPMQVINELNQDVQEGLLNSAGGRFFGV